MRLSQGCLVVCISERLTSARGCRGIVHSHFIQFLASPRGSSHFSFLPLIFIYHAHRSAGFVLSSFPVFWIPVLITLRCFFICSPSVVQVLLAGEFLWHSDAWSSQIPLQMHKTLFRMEFRVHPVKDMWHWCGIYSPFSFILHVTIRRFPFISLWWLSGSLEVLGLRIYSLPSRRIRSSLENSHIIHVSAFFNNTSTCTVGYSPSYYMHLSPRSWVLIDNESFPACRFDSRRLLVVSGVY